MVQYLGGREESEGGGLVGFLDQRVRFSVVVT
jgi:hypothetical protein